MAKGIENRLDRCWRLVSSYTREEAIADGVLVDVTDMAREVGIRHPTAVTLATYSRYVRVPEGVSWQDESGRLWDILWMFRIAIPRADNAPEMLFNLLVQNEECGPRLITLKAIISSGDLGEPVITIMLPEED